MNRRLIITGIALAAALAGCRGDRSSKPPRQFLPDMDDQPRWNPQSGTEFFVDGRVLRDPPEGTVAFGFAAFDPNAHAGEDWAEPYLRERADLLKDDERFYEGKNADGSYLTHIPIEVTQSIIERGKQRFDIYCAVCHGFEGDGQGMVGRRWAAPVPSFHDPKYSDPSQDQGKDGLIFHTIRNGVVDTTGAQKMPAYAHAVNERDAWAIVAYIRTLQTVLAEEEGQ